jgi:hypothetical protein
VALRPIARDLVELAAQDRRRRAREHRDAAAQVRPHREMLEQVVEVERLRFAKTRRDAGVHQVLEQLGREAAALVDLELGLWEPAEPLGVAPVLDTAKPVDRPGAMARHDHLRVEERDVRRLRDPRGRRRSDLQRLARGLQLVPVEVAGLVGGRRRVADVLVPQRCDFDDRARAQRRRLRAAAADLEGDATRRIANTVGLPGVCIAEDRARDLGCPLLVGRPHPLRGLCLRVRARR